MVAKYGHVMENECEYFSGPIDHESAFINHATRMIRDMSIGYAKTIMPVIHICKNEGSVSGGEHKNDGFKGS